MHYDLESRDSVRINNWLDNIESPKFAESASRMRNLGYSLYKIQQTLDLQQWPKLKPAAYKATYQSKLQTSRAAACKKALDGQKRPSWYLYALLRSITGLQIDSEVFLNWWSWWQASYGGHVWIQECNTCFCAPSGWTADWSQLWWGGSERGAPEVEETAGMRSYALGGPQDLSWSLSCRQPWGCALTSRDFWKYWGDEKPNTAHHTRLPLEQDCKNLWQVSRILKTIARRGLSTIEEVGHVWVCASGKKAWAHNAS